MGARHDQDTLSHTNINVANFSKIVEQIVYEASYHYLYIFVVFLVNSDILFCLMCFISFTKMYVYFGTVGFLFVFFVIQYFIL